MSIKRINPSPRWSDATVFNGIGYFVEIAEDCSKDFASQTAQIFAQTEKTLDLIGSDKSRLLSATIYLADLQDFSVFNQAWQQWLPEGCAPSRACMQATLVDPAIRLEIAFVAAAE